MKSSESDESTSVLGNKLQEIFRRHFEAQFEPLSCIQSGIDYTIPNSKRSLEQQDQAHDESDWNGFSDEETSNQIVEYSVTQTQPILMSKAELKSFMSSKPPTQGLSSTPRKDIQDNDDPTEVENIKNDIVLHRFLSESHLFESAKNPTLSGNNRHKAMDLRLQALGSKKSILRQQNMPMTHRKGILAKHKSIEFKRRKNAIENGIILEKVSMENNKTIRKRHNNAIGAPSVGRFSRGILKLSKEDIKNIQGPTQKYPKKKYS
ncbi:hypothetical protein EV44_g5785 [Erysiphe necator]|uniref:Uncharacterized protein n=1 Tax=Uncinula necator TaxID=52586 RepID=A0A0B1P9X7_UNCNE|nr:hypothetical protein EV44_g5785 [Erysiphe necator]